MSHQSMSHQSSYSTSYQAPAVASYSSEVVEFSGASSSAHAAGFSSQHSGSGAAFHSAVGVPQQFTSSGGQAAQFISAVGVPQQVTYSQQAAAGYSTAGSAKAYISQLETAILNANQPISSSESEEITVNGERGIFLNKAEVTSWRGAVALDKYPIYQDPCPQIIRKKATNAEYIQELSIKYLRPRLQAPGPITIRQEPNKNVEPAPPVIIRQQPAGAKNGGNKVFREVPPQLPSAPGPKVISIPGKFNPPPPRKVIIEKLAGFPPKPDNIAVERWVEPEPVKRSVKFIAAPKPECVAKPRNIIIEWEAAQVSVREELKVLGVSDADAAQYRQQHQDLVQASQLPEFAQKAQAPNGLKLAANGQFSAGGSYLYELEGDVQALALVDLDKEGLSEYREYLQRLGVRYQAPSAGEFDTTVQYCPDNCGEAPPPPPPPKPACVCPPATCQC